MSLEEAATQLAEHLQRQEFVEVYAHHDADGIAAGSILCMAMLRKGIKFRLRVRPRISPANISPENATLLCDFGSGLEDLPREVMVVDHHLPHFDGGLHVNPRLFDIDGERELSSSGTAYIIAQILGDNRDLAGLAIPGIIGDGQEFTGRNLDIFNEALAEGIITTGRGYLLTGRDEHERLLTSINPYLHQISGDEMAVADLIESSADEKGLSLRTLISLIILRISPYVPAGTMDTLYGDLFTLEREAIPDARTFTAVIDACGKCGRGGLAASLCFRNSGALKEAWDTAYNHRMRVAREIRNAVMASPADGFYEIEDLTVASDVADALARDIINELPVIVAAKSKELCHLSVRCPRERDMDLGEAVREAAVQCGGFGGGHRRRAGATISCARIGQFRNYLAKVGTA